MKDEILAEINEIIKEFEIAKKQKQGYMQRKILLRTVFPQTFRLFWQIKMKKNHDFS